MSAFHDLKREKQFLPYTSELMVLIVLVTCWGLVVTFSGFTASFGGLCVSRFLVGVFEAGFFPGAGIRLPSDVVRHGG